MLIVKMVLSTFEEYFGINTHITFNMKKYVLIFA